MTLTRFVAISQSLRHTHKTRGIPRATRSVIAVSSTIAAPEETYEQALHDRRIWTWDGAGPRESIRQGRILSRRHFALPRKAAAKHAGTHLRWNARHLVAADAGDPAALAITFDQIHEQLGASEVLLYNAFVFRAGKPTTIAPENLISDFRANVAGALAAAQCVLPAMKRPDVAPSSSPEAASRSSPQLTMPRFPWTKRPSGTLLSPCA